MSEILCHIGAWVLLMEAGAHANERTQAAEDAERVAWPGHKGPCVPCWEGWTEPCFLFGTCGRLIYKLECTAIHWNIKIG